MKPLAIAHVVPSFAVGRERAALDLAYRQQAAGHEVTVFSLAPLPDGPLAAACHAAGLATETVPRKGPRVDPTLPFRLALHLRRRAVDVRASLTRPTAARYTPPVPPFTFH